MEMKLYHGSKNGLSGAIAPIKTVDRIRLLHRRDGESFFEIMERETGGAK